MATVNTAWSELKPLPRADFHKIIQFPDGVKTFSINRVFCALSDTYEVDDYPQYPPKLHKYHSYNDSWSPLKMVIATDEDDNNIGGTPFGINHKDDTIYIAHSTNLISMELQDDDKLCQLTILGGVESSRPITSFRWCTQATFHDGQLHLLGGVESSRHVTCNVSNYVWRELNDLAGAWNIYELLYYASVKIGNKWLIFGGIDGGEYLNTILEYDFKINKWNKISTALPKAVACLAATPISGGTHVLLFGGWDERSEFDNIYIYSLKDKTIQELPAKCPVFPARNLQVISWRDEDNDNLAVNGWIRKTWKESEINDHLYPAMYLIRIICEYYLNDIIDLFCREGGEFRHFRTRAYELYN